ncbi:SDR family oxidoreductase [Vibrio zhanjiangensis]|uniref:SDR family oxidoreductase n=1 Tax=Vibrio zhanjiangensis TaxID=1046128 RepID=A0ABQ6EYM0_9VIBR|nr:SDR family oxidoreductase [Vibrio zhanjiangensis]GLT18310.1 SDR family oxidoreductase [Vibrio zhanjiangensis]
MKVLIFGGNGGIGRSLCQNLMSRYTDIDLHATYHIKKPEDLSDNITWHHVDITTEAAIKNLASQFSVLDLLINTVGVLHTPNHGPEKSLPSCQTDFFLHNMAVNALPTLMMAKHFASSLRVSNQPKFATLSAKVGSIKDNRLGGWYSYRSSKAALNMLIKNISIEWARHMPKACILSIHPGTTDTALSRPFQANVPPQKLFSPDKVADDILSLIERATPECSGRFFAYDGQELPW